MNDLLEILSALHPEVNFAHCDTLIDSGILDSFDLVSLLAEIDEQYGVIITADKIKPEHFNSAPALFALILALVDEN